MKVYRPSDKIKIKVDNLTFTIRPLTYHEKVEIQKYAVLASSDFQSGMMAGYLAIKYAVVAVDGLETPDGSPFVFTGTDEDLDALFNLNATSDKLVAACLNLITGVPSEFKDLGGNKLNNVEFVGGTEGKKS